MERMPAKRGKIEDGYEVMAGGYTVETNKSSPGGSIGHIRSHAAVRCQRNGEGAKSLNE